MNNGKYSMKDKHVYYQNEPGWVIESFVIGLLVFGMQAFGLTLFFIECFRAFPFAKNNIGAFITFLFVSLVLPLIMYPDIFSRFSWNISMNKNKIWMKGDAISAKWWRVQYPVEVHYYDIVSIRIEESTKNSLGQTIVTWFYGPIWSKKRYLVFILKNGEKRRFHVSHYTDARLALIIDKIAECCENAGQLYDGRKASQILF